MNKLQLRANVLAVHQANQSATEELLAYNANIFDRSNLPLCPCFPMDNEPHLVSWTRYAAEAKEIGSYAALKKRLVQFEFPILAGISDTVDYRAATRQGKSTKTMAIATGLQLTEPNKLKLEIHPTIAGEIPVILSANRQDFVTLVQALTKRNEPIAVPDSMGACIVGGYNNWDRVGQYKQQWLVDRSPTDVDSEWKSEFKRLIANKELYQDRFILLSFGTYSNVASSQVGMSEDEWLELSLKIRLEHECTHYFTRRVFGSMRNNLLDELIADYRGIVAALGYYRADWFLHFMGLESFPAYRLGGRLENYRGDPPLSDRAWSILQVLVKKAAENLQAFDDKYYADRPRTFAEEVMMLIALTTLSLEELADRETEAILLEAISA